MHDFCVSSLMLFHCIRLNPNQIRYNAVQKTVPQMSRTDYKVNFNGFHSISSHSKAKRVEMDFQFSIIKSLTTNGVTSMSSLKIISIFNVWLICIFFYWKNECAILTKGVLFSFILNHFI